MLLSVKDLKDYKLEATDGEIGSVKDVYFDDQSWTVRHLVADTGGWLTGRLVLISPRAIIQSDWQGRRIHLRLNKRQVEDSPGIYEDQPVSRQYEAEYNAYYGYPSYWVGPYAWGTAMYPAAPYPTDEATAPSPTEQTTRDGRDDPHLRSTSEVTGYYIRARDGEIGHVEDFLVDAEDWTIRHLAVDTRNWLPGKTVLVPPESIEEVSWESREVRIRLSQEAVRNGPEYDPSSLAGREYHGLQYG